MVSTVTRLNNLAIHRPTHRANPEQVPTDSFTPSQSVEPLTYTRFLPAADTVAQKSAKLVEDAWRQLALIEPPEGNTARCRQELHDVGAKGGAYQIRERHRVLGEPRLNRPYPDPELTSAGVEQNLPMDVKSDFKWLLSAPLVMGKDQDIVLLPTQYEGGPTWLDDGEYECRDFFIAVKHNPETGRYEEIGAKMTRSPGWQDVYRSVGRVEKIPGSDNRFGVHIEAGTHNGLYGKDTLVYEINERGVEQVGEWDGHLPFDQLDRHEQKPRDRWHYERC